MSTESFPSIKRRSKSLSPIKAGLRRLFGSNSSGDPREPWYAGIFEHPGDDRQRTSRPLKRSKSVMGSVRSKLHATISTGRRKTFDNPRSVRDSRHRSGSIQTALDIFENPATLPRPHTPFSSSLEAHDGSADFAAAPAAYPPDEVKRLVDAGLGPSLFRNTAMGGNMVSKLKRRADSGVVRQSLPRDAEGYVNIPETSSHESLVEVEICSKLPLSDLRMPSDTLAAPEKQRQATPDTKPAPLPRTQAARPGGKGANREDSFDSVYVRSPTGEAVAFPRAYIESLDQQIEYRKVSDVDADRQVFTKKMLDRENAERAAKLRTSRNSASTSIPGMALGAKGPSAVSHPILINNIPYRCNDGQAQYSLPGSDNPHSYDPTTDPLVPRAFPSPTRSNGLGGFSTDSGYASKQASDTPPVHNKADVLESDIPDVQVGEVIECHIDELDSKFQAGKASFSKTSTEDRSENRTSISSVPANECRPSISPPMNPVTIREEHGSKLFGPSNQPGDVPTQYYSLQNPVHQASYQRDGRLARVSLDRMIKTGSSALYGRSSNDSPHFNAAPMTASHTVNNPVHAVRWDPEEHMLVPVALEAEYRRQKEAEKAKQPRADLTATSSRSGSKTAAADQAMLDMLGAARAKELRAKAAATVAVANAQTAADAANEESSVGASAYEGKGKGRAGDRTSGEGYAWTDEEKSDAKRALRYADGSLD